MVKDGVLYTPEGRNILRGISRNYVIELAIENGIPVKECNIEPYDVYGADEAFLTGTPFCIIPTTSLNGIDIGNGKMGEMTTRLLDLWSDKVQLDIMDQIKFYGKEVEKLNNAATPYQFRK